MSRSLPHLTLTTSTSSLSPTSPIFQSSSSTHPSLLSHDPYTLRDSRQSGGSTQIPSLTGYEPKVIEPEEIEPRRIELDRILGRIRIKHRIKILSPKILMNLEKVGAEMSYSFPFVGPFIGP